MKPLHTICLVLILVIAPTFSIGMNSFSDETDSLVTEVHEVIDNPVVIDDFVNEDVELTSMHFTETPSVEDGFYYVCRSGVDAIAYFGASEVKYLSGNAVFTLEFPGSNLVVPRGEIPTGSVTNYLLGNNPSEWKTGIADCAVLRYSEIYPSIDLVYKIYEGNLKYEFVVAPDANPRLIQMSYPDASMLDANDVQLTVHNSESSFSDTGLWAFQGTEGIMDVACTFNRLNANTIGFDVGQYDETQVLIIDPLLVYSTFLGGSYEDVGKSIAVENGYIYVTGYTVSPNFPTINAFTSTHSGISYKDCFITKLAPNGQTLIYSTFLGGSLGDYPDGIEIENGFVYIAGHTASTDFPTVNGFNLTSNGGDDAFITKLATDGQSMNYSTYLGGSSHEYTCYIAVENGFAYVTGRTQSSAFPTTPNALNETPNGDQEAFVTKINAAGNGIDYSTYLGGSGWDEPRSIAVENGYAIIAGDTASSDFPVLNGYDITYNGYDDAFVTKLATDGSSLVFSTFYGGSAGSEGCWDMSMDSDFIYITGTAYYDDLPMVNSFDSTHNGGWDVFVAGFTSDGQNLVYSSYIGGSDGDVGYGIALEGDYVYLTGYTYSVDFPTENGIDTTHNGYIDCFVAKLDVRCGKLEYGTYLGGVGGAYTEQGFGIAVESGTAFITGCTNSPAFPTVDAFNSTHGGNYDCFLSIISDDSDYDGLSDWHEGLYGTNPLSIDTDIDGHNDAYEIVEGTDPLDPYSYPGIASKSEYSVAYSSYVGGSSSDYLEFVKVEDGYIYLSGKTSSPNFPMVNAWNSTIDSTDAFIVKMSADGQSIIFSTFIGGVYDETVEGMDIYNGCVFIGGYTNSPNFPTYLAYDNKFNGSIDTFLFKLADDGSTPEFSTYLGGIGGDYLRDICVEDGYAYVVGDTTSPDFPTVSAFDSSVPTTQDAFVTKFAVDGQNIIYSTYLGGDANTEYGYAIAVDDGYAYVGGSTLSHDFPMEAPFDDTLSGMDGFLTKLSKDGRSLVYSSYVGGASTDYIVALSADRGFAYLTGITASSDFPLSNPLFPTKLGGAQQSGFVARMNIDGASFAYSTYLTGSIRVVPSDIVVDTGFACISGYTDSTDFPIVGGSASSCDPTSMDAFVTKIANDGQSLLYSSCVGGTDEDYGRSIDVYNGRMFIAGYTDSDDYPTLTAYNASNAPTRDGFLTIFDIDSDSDALPDFTEGIIGTNPYAVDSDLDNFIDSYEFIYGSDPLVAASYPAISQAEFNILYQNFEGNATLIQNLITWSDGNASLIGTLIDQLDSNSTLLTQVLSWLDGNHTAIETLFTALDGNATLLMNTVSYLNGNSTLIQNLLTWSAGNETLLLSVIQQAADNSTLLAQVIAWLDGNHTAIETLFTYVAGNATLLLDTIDAVGNNTAQLTLLAALVSQNTALLSTLNATHIGDIEEIRAIMDTLGAKIGDTDYDGLDDLDEIAIGTDIQCIDTDVDNLNDAFEVKIGTNPLDDDTDEDMYLDGVEVIAGTDPLDPLSYPGSDTVTTGGTDTGTTTSDTTSNTDDSTPPTGTELIIIVGAIGGVGVVIVIVIIMKKKGRG